jgi:hypothetical protein
MSDIPPEALEDVKETKPLGYCSAPDGSKSSGRLIKVLSIIFAGVLAVSALWFAIYVIMTSGFTKSIDSNFVNLVLGLVGIFGSVAIGSEITQKVTKL